MTSKITLLAALLAFGLFFNCQPQTNTSAVMNTPDTLQNRQPAVAGQFYTSDPAALRSELKTFFDKAPAPDAGREVVAVVSPHAGYVFSGEVAAAAINQFDPGRQYNTVFVIACSHRNSYGGASVYSIGNYITPLGEVKTNLAVARKLAAENKVLSFDPVYHRGEHSLEVQLPFLQFHLKKEFSVVPILLGTQDPERIREIALALKPWFVPGNLFLVSTDFSHYPEYRDAIATDRTVADAIVSNRPELLIKTVEVCTEKNISNLSTGCCSWPGVLALMYLTQDNKDVSYKKVLYRNSGDSKYGEKDRVVGYWAISASLPQKKKEEFSLTEPEKKQLLQVARSTISYYLENHKIPETEMQQLLPGLLKKAGAFVTLKKAGELRGCIGHFEADQPLYKIVQQMAVASSTQDYRFPAVRPDEMKKIDIEISVLTPMQKIDDVNDIRLGTDGIYIKQGYRSGTFLPQVATETGWDLEDFLGHCARDKAGIGWDGWKDRNTEIYVYQALVFGEKE